MNIIKTILLIAFLVVAFPTLAQDDVVIDTTVSFAFDSLAYYDSTQVDSSYHYEDEAELPDLPTNYSDYSANDVVWPNDSSNVVVRKADDATLAELDEDAELNYDTDSPAVWSVWDRFLSKLNDLINSLFYWGDTTDWGQFAAFSFIVVVLCMVILRILKIDALKMFYGASKTNTTKYAVLEENIHEMDFDKLIQDALTKKEFRLAIRLIFLQSLKLLADRQHIYWEPGKTNHDYLREVTTPELKADFAKLNYYFEWAWYGNFNISQETFNHVKDLFNHWKIKIR